MKEETQKLLKVSAAESPHSGNYQNICMQWVYRLYCTYKHFPITRRTMPYIFTDDELRRVFAESDKEPYCKTNPCRHLIIPVIYRLIYFCGLRPNEGRELKRSDFCYEDKTLYIRKNKSHRERLIPVSAGVADMCRQISGKSRAAFPDTEYMFPSPTGEPYQKRWLADTFRRLWDASKTSRKQHKSPGVSPTAQICNGYVYEMAG